MMMMLFFMVSVLKKERENSKEKRCKPFPCIVLMYIKRPSKSRYVVCMGHFMSNGLIEILQENNRMFSKTFATGKQKVQSS